MILAGDWVRWVGDDAVGRTDAGRLGKVHEVHGANCYVFIDGHMYNWQLAHVEHLGPSLPGASFDGVCPIQIDHVKPTDRVAWLPDARESAHVQRLTEDNARLAESMAKLEDAIGLMRETVAEQYKIIAEQARELYRLRRVK